MELMKHVYRCLNKACKTVFPPVYTLVFRPPVNLVSLVTVILMHKASVLEERLRLLIVHCLTTRSLEET